LEIITQYSAWFIILCLLLGVIYASVFYHRNSKITELPFSLKVVLFFFRAFVVSLISFLLLSPFIKSVSTTIEKPILIIAADNSESVARDGKVLQQKVSGLKTAFSNNYEVKVCAFGDKVQEKDSLNFKDKITNFSALFEDVETRYSNKNVGGVIVLSDGMYNSGQNPAYIKKLQNVPVFTLLAGDTSVYKDLYIKELFFNNLTYLGNSFPMELVVASDECINEKTTLSVAVDGETKYTQELFIDKNLLNHKFSLRAEKVGMHKIILSLKVLKGEKVLVNNTREVYVEVLDGRQKILLLGQAPHPDLGAIKSAISANSNYDVTLDFFKDFKGNVDQFNVLILHQLPTDISLADQLLKKAISKKMGLFLVLGTQTNYQSLSKLNTGIQWENSRVARGFNDVYPLLNKEFALFSLDENTKDFFQDVPPLKVPFAQFSVPGDAQSLAYQQVGKVETDLALFSFYTIEESKVCLVSGEGIWRWRMNDFMKNESDVHFNELIQKTIQYISVKEDKSNFKINHKKRFLENEEIILDGEVYNDSYELFNKNPLNIKIINEKGKSFDFQFEALNNRYRLNAGYLSSGSYTYVAQTSVGTKKLEKRGKFVVEQMNLEAVSNKADVYTMKQLAIESNGKFYFINESDKLIKEVNEREDIKPVEHSSVDLKELIHQKWLFFLIVIFLSVEWLLRKRYGLS